MPKGGIPVWNGAPPEAANPVVVQTQTQQVAADVADVKVTVGDVSSTVGTLQTDLQAAQDTLTQAQADIDAAAQAASTAQAAAEAKGIYWGADEPAQPVGGFTSTSVWFKGSDEAGYVMQQWNGTEWIPAALGIGGLAAGAVTNDAISDFAVAARNTQSLTHLIY